MRSGRAAVLLAMLIAGAAVRAQSIATADLQIQGAGLRVVTVSATTGVDIPASIQTEFGGKQNDQAPNVEGLLAVGELEGPGIDRPIRLETAPGYAFAIPALSREGLYFLRDIRLMKGTEFLQAATPAVATITVSNLLQTAVKVRQLTAEELRARGITLDARNYDVFEYTFSFIIDGRTVEIPYSVVIDKRTREIRELPRTAPYILPQIHGVQPPRWSPPIVHSFGMGGGGGEEGSGEEAPAPAGGAGGGRPSIPAALVLPSDLAVLHQFFAVTLMVTNGAPAGSSVTLDRVTAMIRTPAGLRVVKSVPAAAFNQPVALVDANSGVTFLVAQAKGDVDWTIEGLEPGTHTLEVEVRATYKSPGQADFPLKGTARAAVVVHDPRFHINFSHPDTVRKGIDYTTYSFITNMSPVTQTIRVASGIPSCEQAPAANVCRLADTAEFHELTIPTGEMRSIEYHLRPGTTGRVFASAGSVNNEAVTAAVQLFMGVSETGVPLSPTTLVMPYYARYLDEALVEANLQLLGLGYSLATAPLTQATATQPRVIRTDVYQRATDVARAGQRVFIGEEPRDAAAHLALDLLGNAVELREWDDLRRREKSGRGAGASVIRELEKGVTDAGAFVERFATKTAHRNGYVLALLHGPAVPGPAVPGNNRPYALSVRGVASNRRVDVPNEATSGWIRELAFGDLSRFSIEGRAGELAIVGRVTEQLELTVKNAVSGPHTLEVLYPGSDGKLRRARLNLDGPAGQVTKIALDSLSGTLVAAEELAIVAARQDLHLDVQAHQVSVLFNRPADATDWLARVHGEVILDKDGVSYRGPRPISAAALQEDGRILNLTFDHALSKNAAYSIRVDPFPQAVTPVIDNDRPGGIVFGHVLKGDHTPISGAQVQLTTETSAPQYDTSAADGSFLFEFVARDPENGIGGQYQLSAITADNKSTTVNAAVRLPGRVHFVNLVFLGRGSAEGYVRYDDGSAVKNARVTVGSTMFDQMRTATTDANGFYRVADLPVGPLTFTALDAAGNMSFAATELRTPGEVVTQDLSIFRRPFPGTGTIRGIVKRSDTGEPVPGAMVGVYSQGYGLVDAFTDTAGRFEFTGVPSGFVTVLAAEWSVSRESVALDFDLGNDESRDLTLTLNVAPNVPLVTIEGDVIREDPLHPNDPTHYQRVPGAIVKIEHMQPVTADANGRYRIENVPQSKSGQSIEAYDPLTKRSATKKLPSLDTAQVNLVPLFISTADGAGDGTVRVRVLNAQGLPATGLRVIYPGFPPTVFTELANGIYTLHDVAVGEEVTVYAISTGGTYGDQFTSGKARVEFNGHIAAITLRLPGQGTVRVKMRADIDVIGDVRITYPAWQEALQNVMATSRTLSTEKNGLADYAVFEKVPAHHEYGVLAVHPVYGYAGDDGKLAYDGELHNITLQLNKLSTVRGVVYAIDGRTPIPGAEVRIEDGRQNQGVFTTLPDGSFVFHNEPAGTGFRVVAEATQSGVYRTGFATGATPANGGPVENIAVVMRTQGSIDARVVYAGYKKFDPQNPANNIVDDTPADPSDNAPVPLAKFALRELDFPRRSFGTLASPLSADVLGRFSFNNLFTGPLRVTASDPGNQELRGSWTGTLSQEGEKLTAYIAIGATGFGSATIQVVDPNAQNAPVLNAEVALRTQHGVFDFGTTDAAGNVTFEQLPIGTYDATAYSKSIGRSGTSGAFVVVRDQESSVRVVLEFSGEVTGQLIDPEAGGRGVPGAHVSLDAFNFFTRATTGVDGDFFFEGVREGTFRLSAKDTLTNRRATAQRALSQADPRPHVVLQLEPTETLHLQVYEPDDAGGLSNVLVPLVEADVTQCDPCDFMRSLQGNPIVMEGLLEQRPYKVVVTEVGGSQRKVTASASFPKGSAADPLKLVMPAYGSVEVRVTQAGAPAANAKVTVSGSGGSRSVYTDASGVALATGIRLGAFSVQAVSLDGAFSGSASATLSSQSTTAVVSVALGVYAGITGYVEAEQGGPSIGTRVVATFTRTLEAFTDSNGRYTFHGIPTGSTVSLVYVGPDEITVGARQSVTITAADAQKIVVAPNVRLDASVPQLVSFTPADGAQNVSPDTTLTFVFSEPIRADQVNRSFIQLIPADSATAVNASYTSFTDVDGTFVVRLIPPPPAAGKPFPLESNTLYRIVVSGEIRDLTGNKLPSTRGAVFVTSDYAEPRVVQVTPSPSLPLQPATSFRFAFNEPIQWNGTFKFYRTSAGSVVEELPGRAFLDPANPTTLVFAPDAAIAAQSFYRTVFSGVRDLQGNAAAEQTFDFFSFDAVAPFVILQSPVPAGHPLTSGVEYLLRPDLRDGDANGPPATDIARVEYFRVDNGAPVFVRTETKAPFAYRFVGPDATSLTLRAEAVDLSNNRSAPATITWPVQPNAPPRNVAIALTPADSSYANNKVNAVVAFDDEGVLATVQLELKAAQKTGGEYVKSLVRQATRTTIDQPWGSQSFDFDLPATLVENAAATFTATVTDARGQATVASASLTIREDTIHPAVLDVTPAPETRYTIGTKFQVEALVQDLETGIAAVSFQLDGQTINVTGGTPGIQPRSWRFVSGQITVPAKNVDTRVPIVVTATDHHGNKATRTVDVIYVGVNDPAVPKGAWLCPIDKSALPANETAFPLTMQVRATDDIAVTGVKFRIPGMADVTATRAGTSTTWEATANVATPAAGTPFALTAIISDANPDHDVLIPISVELVAVDIVVADRIQAITSADVATYENKSILVRGPTALLIPHVPLTLKNLLILGGARVETLATTTTNEQRLDLTITGRLSIDCASSIDVTARGYLGGWALNPDGSNTRNDDERGRTLGNTVTGGPTTYAGASHAGLGGIREDGVTNAPYGSITDPVDLGTGGGGGTSCCSVGATGGGAVKLRGGVFSIAGAIRANGADHAGNGNPGAGGSVNLSSQVLVTGPSTRITANGGDDDAVNNVSRGGGGGRIALAATERLEIAALGTNVVARGGRNDTATEAASYVDGGAGTIFVRRPGQTSGELFVGAFDDRFPNSNHLTRPTPIAGTLVFDRVELGARALVRADASVTANGVTDDRTAMTIAPGAVILFAADRPIVNVTTTPAANSSLVQGTTLSTSYSATSPAGIGSVRLQWTPVTPDRVDSYSTYPVTAAPAVIALSVPATAPAGATLTVTATDRAGRSASTPLAYTIVENTPPAITRFDVVPLSLYPGKSVAVTASASDDVAVTKLSLTTTIDNGAPSTQTKTPNVPAATDQTFTVTVPIATPGGVPMTLMLAAEDGFAGRAATTQTVAVTILTDPNAPSLAVTAPAADTLFQEASGATIQVRATASDAEVGVKQVFVQVDGGTQYPLTAGANNTYSANIPLPPVDGAEIVHKQLVVTAKDHQGNSVSSAVPIRIQPLYDPDAPVIAVTCFTDGAMVPAGYAAKFRVYAIGNSTGNTANGIQKVELFLNDSPTPIPMTAVSGLANHYEAAGTFPAGTPDGTIVTLRAVATNTASRSTDALSRVTVVTGTVIAANTTISASDTSYDGKTVIVQSGTTTIVGAHTFARLLVLSGAKVTHAATDATTINRLTVDAQSFYVACDASIDASGLGFSGASAGSGRTWPNATAGGSVNGAGGSHGGRGGAYDATGGGDSAQTFGSATDPDAPGGAGGAFGGATCAACNAGGGIARLKAAAFVLDGKLLANGATPTSGGGAGGSIRIDAGMLSGAGEIHADGTAGTQGAGGGGRIAVYYQGLLLPRAKITAAGGPAANATRTGGAGTIYFRLVGVDGAKIVDELVLDNLDRIGTHTTPLPAGTFDSISIRGAAVATSDTLGTSVLTTSTNAYLQLPSLQRDALTLRGWLKVSGTTDVATLRLDGGRLEAAGLVKSTDLTLANLSTLTHPPTTATTIHRLVVDATTLTVDATSTIDVSGRGFSGSVAGSGGRTWPNVTTGGSVNGAGGSHGGRGGANGASDSGQAYGSLFDPNEPGGAGAAATSVSCDPCNAGGGIARVTAGTFTLDGKVLANGVATNNGGGAGGSIRIDAGTLSGSGEIRADGATGTQAAGGGGRIAVYAQSLLLDTAKILAAGGAGTDTARTGAAGTLYLPQQGLVVDNADRAAAKDTVLPSHGSGTITAVDGTTLTLSAAVPEWIEGSWIEAGSASAQIVGRTATTVTTASALNAAPGAAYRGTWRFDQVTARKQGTLNTSVLRTPLVTTTSTGLVRVVDLVGDDVTLRGRVEASGVVAANLALRNGAWLTHPFTTATTIQALTVNVVNGITVDATSAIDVSGRGFAGGRTWPNGTTGGSIGGAGGSHAGRGGANGTNESAQGYGSLFDPRAPGGAGAGCATCNAGGGIARITARTFALDGNVLAGGVATDTGGGAGGSIRIDADALSGGGAIRADGAAGTQAAGGGGRIAIYTNTLSLPRANVIAAGGTGSNSARTGAAGTVYFKAPAQAYGDLVVDNIGRVTTRNTQLTSVGFATVTEAGAAFVKDANANFAAPDLLAGLRLVLNHNTAVTWPITSNDAKTLNVSTPTLLTAQTGDGIRGLYRFDSATLRNARLEVLDLFEATIDKDASSVVLGSNRAPVLDATKVSVQSTSTASIVVGTAGAATDPDQPLALTATNTASGNTWTATASADGAFTIAVQGNAGDTITLKARDANFFPLEATITAGTLATGTPTPSQLDRTAWTADPNFRARRLAVDDRFLTVYSNASAEVAVLSLADPARPNFVRTVNAGGPVHDVAITNGWAVIASNDLVMVDLNNPASIPVPIPNVLGAEVAVTIAGGYAYAATNNADNGRIHIYDVSNPSSARFIREHDFNINDLTFAAMASYGNYLLAISSERPFGVGYDVVVIDRTNIYNPIRVKTLDVPNFDPTAGWVSGSRLYLTSSTSRDLVIVDLADPRNPQVTGRLTLPANAQRAAAVKTSAFVADGAAGLIEVDAANAAAPLIVGTVATGGTAYDVRLLAPYAYVANDNGIAVVPVTAPPQIEPSRVSMSLSGATVTITGVARAVTGIGALTIAATNGRSGVASAPSAVNADGSFTAAISALTNDPITIEATDSAGRKSGPVSLGPAPFGAGVGVTLLTPANSEPNYHARTLATDGTHLIVGGYQDAGTTALAIFDVTDPAAPRHRRTVPLGAGAINAVGIRNGWAIVAADELVVLDLGSDTSVPRIIRQADGVALVPGNDLDLVIDGGYAFTTTNNADNARLHVYDVNNPANAHYLREFDLGINDLTFTGLAALGSRYLVAMAGERPFGVGHDAVVIDRSNVHSMVKVEDLDIQTSTFNGFRGKVLGTTLYLAGTGGGVAVVDLSNPASAVVRTIVPTGDARGIDIAGSMVAVANGSGGVAFLQAGDPNAPQVLGTQFTGGAAWSVAFNGRHVYVANDQGLAVIPNVSVPLVHPSRVTITPASGTLATISGSAASITGLAPLQIEVKNARSGASISGRTVNADGSFSVLLSGRVDDVITVEATDAAGRKSGPAEVGRVPFGSTVTTHVLDDTVTGESFRARTLATDGTHLVVAGWGEGTSTSVAIFDVTDAASPRYVRTVPVGSGPIYNVGISNGWAVIAANDVAMLDLSSTTSTPRILTGITGVETDVLVSGGYAFTATNNADNGRLHIYDVSRPSNAAYLHEHDGGINDLTFTGLAALGDNHLLGFASERPFGVGHDLVVFERSNVHGLVKRVDLDLDTDQYNAFRGKVVGTTLYLAGRNGGLAIYDMSNPVSPVLLKQMFTPGSPYQADGAGSLVAIADGGSGVTFLDVTNPASPVILGTQAIGGTAWSLAFNRGHLYVANELGLVTIRDIGAAPTVTASLVDISSNGIGQATITGRARAVAGVGAMTVEARNAVTGATANGGSVAADGSFSVTIAAQPGQLLTVEATDEAGRKSGRTPVGTVPFGVVSSVLITPEMSGDGHRARTLATDGKWLITGGYGDAVTTHLNIFDVSDPAAPPRFRRSVPLGSGAINAVAIHEGWAIVAANDLVVLDLGNPASVPDAIEGITGTETDLLVSGGYAFTTTNNADNGRIHVYDVADPSRTRYIREQDLGFNDVTFTGLAAVGSAYMVASTRERPFNVGHDVVVIDRSNPYALRVLADVDISTSQFNAFRGKAVGTTLYLGGIEGGLAVVDLSTPATPSVKMILPTAGDAFGADASGSVVAVADGSAGVTFLDVTNPFAPSVIGTQPMGGTVWSAQLLNGTLYAVNEQSLVAVRNVATPVIEGARISIATDSASTITVSGAARAITGVAPLSVRVRNTTASTGSASVTVAADGGFTATLAAVPGDALFLDVTDAGGRTVTHALGMSRFGTAVTRAAGAAQAGGDDAFRARRVASNGTVTVTGSGSAMGLSGVSQSGNVLVFRNGVAQSYDAGDTVSDVAIHNGYALIAAADFSTLDLSNPAATPFIVTGVTGAETSVAVLGNFAYTATTNADNSRVHQYDIANPAAPKYVREYDFQINDLTFSAIVPAGSSHLVAVSPERPFNVGHDAVIIDASNPAALVKRYDLDVDTSLFNAVDAVADGTWLYLAGNAAGIAVVDIANPAAPLVKAILKTPGAARGVVMSGPNELAVADGSSGVTIIDVTNPAAPVIRGTQRLGDTNTTGVHVTGRTIHAVADDYLHEIRRPE